MENILLGFILFFSLGRDWQVYLLDVIDLVIEALEPDARCI